MDESKDILDVSELMAHRRGFELLTEMPKDTAMVPLNEMPPLPRSLAATWFLRFEDAFTLATFLK
jgi:hypothetical protein